MSSRKLIVYRNIPVLSSEAPRRSINSVRRQMSRVWWWVLGGRVRNSEAKSHICLINVGEYFNYNIFNKSNFNYGRPKVWECFEWRRLSLNLICVLCSYYEQQQKTFTVSYMIAGFGTEMDIARARESKWEYFPSFTYSRALLACGFGYLFVCYARTLIGIFLLLKCLRKFHLEVVNGIELFRKVISKISPLPARPWCVSSLFSVLGPWWGGDIIKVTDVCGHERSINSFVFSLCSSQRSPPPGPVSRSCVVSTVGAWPESNSLERLSTSKWENNP